MPSPGGMRGSASTASLTIVAPKSDEKGCFLRLALGAFPMTIECAEKLADELEADEAFILWTQWEPSPGDRARFVELLRREALRARTLDREKAEARAKRAAATPGPPRG